jgi:hypothetical protein
LRNFAPEFIIRVETVTRGDGTVQSVPHKIPKLAVGAYPFSIPNTSAYLSSEQPKKRKMTDERHSEMAARDEEQFSGWMQEDQIACFDDLRSKVNQKLTMFQDCRWITLNDNNCLRIVNFDLSRAPRITKAIKIHSYIVVDVYKGESHVNNGSLHRIPGSKCRLACWSQLTSFHPMKFTLNLKQRLRLMHCWQSTE